MVIYIQEMHLIGHSFHYFCGGWVVGWLENWRVITISAFIYVIVEVVAEIGNIYSEVLGLKVDLLLAKTFSFDT